MRLTLCGSTKFRPQWEEYNKLLTLEGHIVYSVGGFGHAGDTFTEEQKEMLDLVHLRKIALSEAIVVLNVDGYIGDSTRKEIKWARLLNQSVYYLSPIGVSFDWVTSTPVEHLFKPYYRV